jgi:hypothetical protein
MQWRLQVATPNNTAVATYGPNQTDGDGGIVSIDSFDVDSAGNCLTMQFQALPSRNAIGPRYIITLQLYDTTSSSWVSVWKGVATTIGTTRSDRVQTYEALGLKQRMYEAPIVRLPYWPDARSSSTDAADLPLFANTRPIGATSYPGVTRDANSTPLTGFSIGIAQTDFQIFGEFLDQRAGQVGAFIVPPSETYVYDGLTFNAGEVVPPVRWGVDATGYFFFRRVFDTPLGIDETDANVSIEWRPVSTENQFTYPYLLLFPGGPQPNILTVLAREERTGSNPYFAEMTRNAFGALYAIPTLNIFPNVNDAPLIQKVIEVSNPLDYYVRRVESFAANANWNNLADGTDGDLTSFANVSSGAAVAHAAGSAVNWSDPSVIEMDIATTFPASNVVVLWYSSDSPMPILTKGSFTLTAGGTTTTRTNEIVYEFPATNTSTEIIPRQVVIPLNPPAPAATGTIDPRDKMKILGVTELRIYDCAIFELNVDVRNRVMESLIKPLQQEAAIVDVQGYQPIATELDIAPGDGGTNVLMPVERIEYSITIEGGIATRYYAGQRYDAGLEDEAAVLDALVRRLTKSRETL